MTKNLYLREYKKSNLYKYRNITEYEIVTIFFIIIDMR